MLELVVYGDIIASRGVVQLVLVHEDSEMTSKYKYVQCCRLKKKTIRHKVEGDEGYRQLKKSEIETDEFCCIDCGRTVVK